VFVRKENPIGLRIGIANNQKDHLAALRRRRSGVLRFGKLTMTDSDLELVNDPPGSPFDFSPSDYNVSLWQVPATR